MFYLAKVGKKAGFIGVENVLLIIVFYETRENGVP
jgi:hypothetical protein